MRGEPEIIDQIFAKGRRSVTAAAPPNRFPTYWPMCGSLYPSCGLGSIRTQRNAVLAIVCASFGGVDCTSVFKLHASCAQHHET